MDTLGKLESTCILRLTESHIHIASAERCWAALPITSIFHQPITLNSKANDVVVLAVQVELFCRGLKMAAENMIQNDASIKLSRRNNQAVLVIQFSKHSKTSAYPVLAPRGSTQLGDLDHGILVSVDIPVSVLNVAATASSFQEPLLPQPSAYILMPPLKHLSQLIRHASKQLSETLTVAILQNKMSISCTYPGSVEEWICTYRDLHHPQVDPPVADPEDGISYSVKLKGKDLAAVTSCFAVGVEHAVLGIIPRIGIIVYVYMQDDGSADLNSHEHGSSGTMTWFIPALIEDHSENQMLEEENVASS